MKDSVTCADDEYSSQERSALQEEVVYFTTNKAILTYLMNDNYNLSLVILVSAICVLLLILLILMICCCCRRRGRDHCDPDCPSDHKFSKKHSWLCKLKKKAKRPHEKKERKPLFKRSYDAVNECREYNCPAFQDSNERHHKHNVNFSRVNKKPRSRSGQEPADSESLQNYVHNVKTKTTKSHKVSDKTVSQKEDRKTESEDGVLVTETKHKKYDKQKRKDLEKIKHKISSEQKKKREDNINEKSVVLTFKLGLPRNEANIDQYYAPTCESPHKKLVLTDSSTDLQEIQEIDRKDLKVLHQSKFSTQNNNLQTRKADDLTAFLYPETMKAEKLAEINRQTPNYTSGLLKIAPSHFKDGADFTQNTPNFSSTVPQKQQNFTSKIPELSSKQNYRSYQTIPEKLSSDFSATNGANQEMVTIPIDNVFGKDSMEILSELKNLDQTKKIAEKETYSYNTFSNNSYNK